MRSPARRRPLYRQRGENAHGWVFYGEIVEDGITGVRVPKMWCVRQRGVLVDRRYRKGSRDHDPSY